MDWSDFPKMKRTASAADFLPKIRTAYYEDLSESEASVDGENSSAFVWPEADLEGHASTSKVTKQISQIQEKDVPHGMRSAGAEDEQQLDDLDVGDDYDGVEYDDNDNGDNDDEDDGHHDDDDDNDDDNPDDDFDNDNDTLNNIAEAESNNSSMSTWSGDSHFTELERIDLIKQAQKKWDYRHGHLYYLGSIWDLRSRRHNCDLCYILWRRTRTNAEVKTSYLTKSRCVLRLIELKGKKSDGSDKAVNMLNLLYIYAYKVTDDPKDSDWIVKYPYIIQGVHRDIANRFAIKTLPLPFADELYGQARPRNDKCNYDLLRQWLRTCEMKHRHPVSVYAKDLSIRLIDVKQKCLIEWSGTVSEAPRYLALSYVWGAAQQQVVLTRRLLNRFKRPGYLDCRLNQTMRDSIELTARIGETYIWIDALCILQDVPEDKANQIPQMHQIYGLAILTIVAASGSNANSGLPGVNVQRRPIKRYRLELDDICVTMRSNRTLFFTELDIGFAENYLTSSTYLYRAWTFQESMLSRRLLIFAKDQVHWECDRCTWCEETHWESETVDFVGWRALKNSTPFDIWADAFDRRAYDLVLDEPTEKLKINSYAHLIGEYTNRTLTHDEDILDACTGVLSSIKEQEDSEFLFGLRTKHFGNDLLFNTLTFTMKRFASQASIMSPFPTWSWVSWRGKIDIPNEPRYNSYDPVENMIPCDGVRCYMLEIDQSESKYLRLINENGGWQFSAGYVRRGEGIWDPPIGTRKDDSHGQEKISEIPEHSQDLTLANVESLPVCRNIVPHFHILFYTFSSTVFLQTDYEQVEDMMGNLVEAFDTENNEIQREAAADLLQNRRTIRRTLYTCREKPSEAGQSREEGGYKPQTKPQLPEPKSVSAFNYTQSAFHTELPPNLEQDLDMGSLLPPAGHLTFLEHAATIPDGVYRFLWMNNNQIPTFQHLLCKPVSPSASNNGKWDGEILQRVSGAMGPISILEKAQQEKFAAEWRLHILG
ncbi:MAG: hypothetical protein LQ351_007677 [Letrouitia transgressa]|nr:MAG: hypothetical protein LQ351_007677 [Letrouitia transgressa]